MKNENYEVLIAYLELHKKHLKADFMKGAKADFEKGLGEGTLFGIDYAIKELNLWFKDDVRRKKICNKLSGETN